MRIRDGLMMGVLGCALALGACDADPDPDGGTRDAASNDAGPGPVDAGPADSGPVDSGPTDAGPTDAGPTDAGPPPSDHCGATDLILANVEPGVGITVFNPTDAAIATGSYVFCQQPRYPTLESLESGVTIAAGASHTFPWPSNFADTVAGGEVGFYTGGPFGRASNVIDFVCWGTPKADGSSRRDTAIEGGQWSGDCAAAITGGSISRIPDSDGRSPASYDPTGSAAALSCE